MPTKIDLFTDSPIPFVVDAYRRNVKGVSLERNQLLFGTFAGVFSPSLTHDPQGTASCKIYAKGARKPSFQWRMDSERVCLTFNIFEQEFRISTDLIRQMYDYASGSSIDVQIGIGMLIGCLQSRHVS